MEAHQGAAQAEPLTQLAAAEIEAAGGADHPGSADPAGAGGG